MDVYWWQCVHDLDIFWVVTKDEKHNIYLAFEHGIFVCRAQIEVWLGASMKGISCHGHLEIARYLFSFSSIPVW